MMKDSLKIGKGLSTDVILPRRSPSDVAKFAPDGISELRRGRKESWLN
jgi:hypothetical protein